MVNGNEKCCLQPLVAAQAWRNTRNSRMVNFRAAFYFRRHRNIRAGNRGVVADAFNFEACDIPAYGPLQLLPPGPACVPYEPPCRDTIMVHKAPCKRSHGRAKPAVPPAGPPGAVAHDAARRSRARSARAGWQTGDMSTPSPPNSTPSNAWL